MLEKIKKFFEELEADSLENRSNFLEDLLNKAKEEGKADIEQANTVDELKVVQTKYFGKKGLVPDLMKYMGKVSNKDKPLLGKIIHEFKTDLENHLNQIITEIEKAENQAKLEAEKIDVTLPGTNSKIGHKHPLTLVEDQIKEIFTNIGFTVVEGFEIEEDYYNFERLNIPKDHPAREMQDTFYLNDDVVLRTIHRRYRLE